MTKDKYVASSVTLKQKCCFLLVPVLITIFLISVGSWKENEIIHRYLPKIKEETIPAKKNSEQQTLKEEIIPPKNTSEQQTIKQLPLPPKKQLSQERYLIFQCRNGQECGGLADRQKGIVTAYVISQLLGVRFGIDINKPCPITDYLVPNSINWTVPAKVLTNKNRRTVVRIGHTKFDAQFAYENISRTFPGPVNVYKGNIDLIPILMDNPLFNKLSWTKGLSHYDVYKYVNDRLFNFSASTQKKFDNVLQKVQKGKLICAHIRIGRSSTMPRDVPRVHTAADPKAVIPFLKNKTKHEKSYKIFLATDSDNVRKMFRDSFLGDFLEIEGKIVHVNLAAANRQCSGVEKAFLDQKVLSLCDTLVISYSGFSRMAALFRGRDEDLFEAKKSNITPTHRLDPSFSQYLKRK